MTPWKLPSKPADQRLGGRKGSPEHAPPLQTVRASMVTTKKSDRIATLNAVQLGHSRRGSAYKVRCRTSLCNTYRGYIRCPCWLRNSLRVSWIWCYVCIYMEVFIIFQYIYIYTCRKSYVRDVLMKGTTHMSLIASYVTLSPRLKLPEFPIYHPTIPIPWICFRWFVYFLPKYITIIKPPFGKICFSFVSKHQASNKQIQDPGTSGAQFAAIFGPVLAKMTHQVSRRSADIRSC